MSDYIKREDALKAVDAFIGTDPIVERIKLIPSADVAPVRHGRWEKEYGHYKCLLCNCLDDFADNYCPNCGAKMDGEQDDD